jgi:hypothetical protein
MPVTIEVAVTETESEKKLQLAMADLVGNHSDVVSSAVESATNGLLSKAVNLDDGSRTDGKAAASSELERARARHFDARTDVETAPGGASQPQKQELAAAKDDYNAARRLVGLDQI